MKRKCRFCGADDPSSFPRGFCCSVEDERLRELAKLTRALTAQAWRAAIVVEAERQTAAALGVSWCAAYDDRAPAQLAEELSQ